MKRIILLIFLLILTPLLHAESKTTFDGRFGTPCTSWAKNPSKQICTISFYKLISSPEKYQSEVINITGFLVNVFGRPVLFPSRNSYDGDIQIEGIELVGKLSLSQVVKAHLSSGLFPVTVTGTFDAKYVGPDVPRLGALHDIASIKYAPRIPEKPSSQDP